MYLAALLLSHVFPLLSWSSPSKHCFVSQSENAKMSETVYEDKTLSFIHMSKICKIQSETGKPGR